MTDGTTDQRTSGSAGLLDDCRPLGIVLELDFDSATVLAEDDRVRETGGVPRGAFQLAAARTREAGELLLLRGQGSDLRLLCSGIFKVGIGRIDHTQTLFPVAHK